MTAPLDLFPPAIVNIMNFLPFSYIFYYPVKIIQTDLDWQLIAFVLTRQLIFLGILLFINQTLYKKGVKKYEAVGR
jgi:ABC-2 type transport system permease protein